MEYVDLNQVHDVVSIYIANTTRLISHICARAFEVGIYPYFFIPSVPEYIGQEITDLFKQRSGVEMYRQPILVW